MHSLSHLHLRWCSGGLQEGENGGMDGGGELVLVLVMT